MLHLQVNILPYSQHQCIPESKQKLNYGAWKFTAQHAFGLVFSSNHTNAPEHHDQEIPACMIHMSVTHHYMRGSVKWVTDGYCCRGRDGNEVWCVREEWNYLVLQHKMTVVTVCYNWQFLNYTNKFNMPCHKKHHSQGILKCCKIV